MSQSSIEQSSRPSASSSFHDFISISYFIPDSKKAAPRMAAAFVASGDIVDEMDELDPDKAPSVLATRAADHPLIIYGVKECGDPEAIEYLAAELNTPLLDVLKLARILLPRLRDHEMTTVASSLGIEGVDIHLPERRPAHTGHLFSGLLDIIYTLNLESLRSLARLSHGATSDFESLFVEAESYRIRNAFINTPKYDRSASWCIPSINVTGAGVIGGDDSLEDEDAPLDFQQLDTDEITSMFDPGGLFERTMDRYEHRTQQTSMARGVTDAFNDSEVLVVEAGTGTGKSLAYLVPAIFWALRNDQRVIISTNTKNLQEQLFFKDMPFLLDVLQVDFRATLLKGRSNYICLDRWRHVLGQPEDHLTIEEREAALPLVTWLDETQTGDITENAGFNMASQRGLWQKINAEGGACPRCVFKEECYVNRVRSAAALSHIVIINHALLFSDLAADNAVLNDYSHLIIDEAHNLEKVAVQHMTIEAGGWRMRNILRKLYVRDGMETGLLATLKWRSEHSPMKQVWKDALAGGTRLAIDRVNEVERAIETFFKTINDEALNQSTDRSGYAAKLRYGENDVFNTMLNAAMPDLMQRFIHLRDAMGRLGATLNDIPESWLADREEFLNTITATLESCKTIEENLMILTQANEDNTVYWAEASHNNPLSCILVAAPLNVAERLYEDLFSQMRTVILTSATLAIGSKFDHMINRIGLSRIERPRLKVFEIGSPFNYQDQALVCVPSSFPSPKADIFQAAISELILGLVVATRRSTLVLFTSYSMLDRTFTDLEIPLSHLGIPVMAQGISGPRSLLLDRFRSTPGSVLLGTDSFWEGVDVPGEALEMVVMVKLPFAVPSEPIIQAQVEQMEEAGRNSFMEFLVPEAVIKFRQGFGRLIRSGEDYGAVVVLDHRVISTRYGQLFLDSLPAEHQIFKDADHLVEGVTRWFDTLDKRRTTTHRN
jgi:predicted DnaQ family exonuclease/DinG family helicase